MQLHALVSHAVLEVGHPVLGHGGGGGVKPALVVDLDALVGEGAADGDLSLQGCQLVLDGLEVGQGLAESLPLPDVPGGKEKEIMLMLKLQNVRVNKKLAKTDIPTLKLVFCIKYFCGLYPNLSF